MKNFQLRITGKIQKTGFHYFVKQLAQLNNIKGFVNVPDEEGITIEAEGRESDLNRFIEFCLVGPEGALINTTNISENPVKHYQNFTIIEHSDLKQADKHFKL
ncbi:MAG: acylphosphatase [Bacteroidales bacterium]|jgi:acylphosphatase|nr:acylphosphatase [Bacteroidales bacterium]MCF8456595.1 acylphosphatase [Bacteroidales bacterium]